ncbi:MAG: tRNA preQ1(34) S-adenosylmethionine ribosyltransferase-isomerase QueA [Planctomycetaceae bacterium]|jgi:S-adenosylmethionine:tRNA ribosyltransferase-isomerase|nr:tRNA preQ1(34) S-adenosylmethionine ribosyltransferase-isomerase QueA [Planctomycetaceae bacterium]
MPESENEFHLLSHYGFQLPQELIAQMPTVPRSDSRLMVVNRQDETIRHAHVRDIAQFLRPEDCLVLNNTKVIPARLIGRRAATYGYWEGLFLEADEHGLWKILCKTRGKLQSGEKILLQTSDGHVGFSLEMLTKQDDGNWLVKPLTDEKPDRPSGTFSYEKTLSILNQIGWVPLPPYIRNGRMLPSDKELYQTVYASQPGAVAAPTAGLHFSPELLMQIQNLGVDLVPVTLHVGAGTFRPISVEHIDKHVMHDESCEISEKAVARIQKRQKAGGRVIAVGTTSVRTLESATDQHRVLKPFSGTTTLFIKPGYEFRIVDAMMTNFHLPFSTLLVLVRTFGGDDLLKRAYEEAIAEQYRFFSYGDAMLIL